MAEMNNRERIEAAVQYEFPQCSVRFDDVAGDGARFAVLSGDGVILTSESPRHSASDAAIMSDAQLRLYVRFICGS